MPRKRYDVLLLGGGTACGYAAAAFRERDKNSTLAIITADDQPPYDRPPLSKKFIVRDDFTPEDIHAKEPSFYLQNNVDLMLETEIAAIDTEAKEVILANGSKVEFGKALYALGSSPVELEALADAPNTSVLRTTDDAVRLRAMISAADRVALVGGGYIGAEAAAALAGKGAQVTIIEKGDSVWSLFPSKTAAQAVHRYLEEMGVRILTNQTAVERAEKLLRTDKGEDVPADVVVVCVGARPNISLAKQAGLEMGESGVKASSTLQTSDPNIWVAGDVAEYPDIVIKRDARIEHHLHAKWTGEHAGRALAGEIRAYRKVPYFFSDVGDLSMILRGDPQPDNQVFLFGDPREPAFTELYLTNDGNIAGLVDLRKDYKAQEPIDELFERLILEEANLSSRLDDLRNPSFNLLDLNR
jgi:3-phenylpropionate/trans-cinnamate dioxygenase ferredoxin reductase subunit